MEKEIVDQLTMRVAKLVKLKGDITQHQINGKILRQRLKAEEESVAVLMNKLSIGECNTNDVCVKLSTCTKHPTASFKNILPLIEKVFNATPEDMLTFLEAVKSFKQTNVCELTKVVCKSKREPKTKVPKFPKGVVVPPTQKPHDSLSRPEQQTAHQPPSLASALSSL